MQNSWGLFPERSIQKPLVVMVLVSHQNLTIELQMKQNWTGWYWTETSAAQILAVCLLSIQTGRDLDGHFPGLTKTVEVLTASPSGSAPSGVWFCVGK